MEAMFNEFEYFAPDVIQTSKLRTYKQEILPLSALQRNAAIEFYYAGEANHYIDIAKCDLLMTTRITLANGNAIVAANHVGPINSPLDSLISNLEVTLGGKVISDQNYMYPWRANFEDVLSQNTDMQNSQLQSKLFYKDKAGQMLDFATVDGSDNTGLVARATPYRLSAVVDLIGRLHGDIFQQPRAIPPNMSLKIKITPTTDAFLLVGPAPVAAQAGGAVPAQELYKMEIQSAVLRLQIIEVSPEFELAQQRMLQRTNQKLPIKHVTMKHLTIPTGQVAVQQENVYLGRLPELVVVAMVTEAAMAGGYQQNPYNYQNFGLNYLSLYVNGHMFPSRAFTPDFVNGRYINEYIALFDGMGMAYSDKTITIDRNEFANGYTLFVFDLTSDKNSGGTASVPNTGSIRLEVKFAAATQQPIKLILYGLAKSWIEIDKFRNVIVPF